MLEATEYSKTAGQACSSVMVEQQINYPGVMQITGHDFNLEIIPFFKPVNTVLQ